MGQKSLVVDFVDLILYDPSLADRVVENPSVVLESFNQALLEIILRENPEFAKLVKKFYVRIRNPPLLMKIRELNSDHIGKLVSVEGIVTRVTRVDAKLLRAKYRHFTESGEHEFDYPPEGYIGERVERPPYCPICHKPGKFELVVEKSDFIDWQKIVVQERPEEVPGGQIPRSIETILTGDIVDSVRPGDRVIVSGILRVLALTGLPERRGSGTIFSFYIDVNHIDVQEKVLEEITITREDEEKIRELARDPWIREKIISSIAPGIYGYWDIKEAIALLLFGGTPKILPDGTRIRGDIHVLITGDPGTAKSQLLQFTSRLAPRGLYTSGKGSTAAGLTATVLRDKITGEYYLEAGALVLADGGIACLHPDTHVIIDKEWVKIGDLFRPESAIKALSNGELVELNYTKNETVSIDLSDLSSKRTTATCIRRKPWKGKLIKLTFESGNEILLTPEHLLIDGETLEWKKAEELKPGNRVLSLRKVLGHNNEIYILDVIPHNWLVIIDAHEKEELYEVISKFYGSVHKLARDSNKKIYENESRLYIEVELLRGLLKDAGKYEDWRRRTLTYLIENRVEKLSVSKVTPELAYLLGLFLGNSKSTTDSKRGEVSIKLPSDYKVVCEAAIKFLTEITSRRPTIVVENNEADPGDRSNFIGLRIESSILSHLFEYLAEREWTRLLKLPDDALRGFIAGLVDSAGLFYVTSKNSANKGDQISYLDIELRSVDQARLISIILRRFDICSKIMRKKDKVILRVSEDHDLSEIVDIIKPYSTPSKNVRIISTKKPKPLGEETIPKVLSIGLAKEIINKVQPKALTESGLREVIYRASRGELALTKRWLNRLRVKLLHALPEEVLNLLTLVTSRDYYVDRVTDVSYIEFEGFVYDLYVPGLHNYLAEGIIVHNCIDEIDKMRDEDRSAIHEALEQQTVSIAKAGIVARLNARTSVLAAGNPKYGRYDSTQPVSRNIDLPPTILSRFDLIFIVQDIPNADHDRRLAKHILGIHTEAEKARGFVDSQLLKKYISYARRYIRPQLTPEAIKLIEEFYVNLRQASLVTSEGGPSAIAITPRQLEALIRLAEAHAKIALKSKATIEDAEEAIRLVMATLSRVGFDIESGKIDIDILETGVSASRREKKKRFASFLSKLLDEVGGEIELNELYKRAQEQGFEKDFVLEVIDELKKSGEIYFPKIGRIARVR